MVELRPVPPSPVGGASAASLPACASRLQLTHDTGHKALCLVSRYVDRAYLWVPALGHTLGPVLMHGHTYVECILYLPHRPGSCSAIWVRGQVAAPYTIRIRRLEPRPRPGVRATRDRTARSHD
eukprot:COSAG02_NODE_1573_length_11882_cov_5.506832_3_plen_124_part_00